VKRIDFEANFTFEVRKATELAVLSKPSFDFYSEVGGSRFLAAAWQMLIAP
jgi:hypothetical protein